MFRWLTAVFTTAFARRALGSLGLGIASAVFSVVACNNTVIDSTRSPQIAGGSGSIPEGCTCLNPADQCTKSTCVTPSYECDALHGCRPDQSCKSGRCVCRDPDQCGIACSSDAGCPSKLACDVHSGICRPPLVCLSDAMCSSGDACLPDPAKGAIVCRPLGVRDVGDDCSDSAECASGICSNGLCLPKCNTNSDCPSGLQCELVRIEPALEGHESRLACVAQTDCGTCPSDMYCWGTCFRNCHTHKDCPGARCSFDQAFVDMNVCLEGTAICGPDEVGMGSACIIYTACFTDADCPAPYACLHDVWVDEESPPGGTYAMCGRSLG